MAHDDRVHQPRLEAGMGVPVRTPVAGVYADSVLPVTEADLTKLIRIEGAEFLEGWSFLPTAGHSIDHASIPLRDKEPSQTGEFFNRLVVVLRPRSFAGGGRADEKRSNIPYLRPFTSEPAFDPEVRKSIR
jgi:hypothetical protein